MAASVLHQFLERRLLDIGDDDAKFGRLQQAAATLVGRLESDPSWAVPFALAAADPATPPEDQAFVAAHEAVAAAWPTYRNSKWQDAPTEVWRAVLLEALAARGADDADVAAAGALTLASVLPRLESGTERDVLVDVYGALRRVAEVRAAEDWGDAVPQPRPRVSKPKPAADAKEPAKPPAVDAERLRKLFARASGPTAQDGTVPFKDPNPNWSSTAPNWSYEFAPRAAAAVADVVDAALGDVAARIAQAREGTQAQFTQWATATGETLRQAVADVARGAQGVQRRSALLWWRAALVSPATGQSYRDLPLAAAAIQMAADLHAAVPPHAPESVEHFLREAVRDLLRDSRPALDGGTSAPASPERTPRAADPSVAGLPEGASATAVPVVEVVRAASERVVGLPEAEPYGEGRATLLEVVSAAVRARAARAAVDVNALAGRLGPAGGGTVALDEAAAWVFRDMQALRVAAADEEAEAAA